MKIFFVTILTLSVPLLAHSKSVTPAKEVMCRACHGAGGAAPIAPNYPKLNGQNRAYLISSLKAYKNGERKGALAAAMSAQAAQLSDADMEALANYYASQK